MSLVQLITTLDSREQALSLGRDAVEARTAACVQVIGPITSVYRWQGEMEEAEEFLCLLKVPSEGLERLVQFVRDRHPYDTPELTAVGSTFVDERYLAWTRSETA
ncbi:MAG TPA: divalent-cation tolerance protein CutA [Actinomycetota bacterium]|nr:divalent-cation tolerance protein CutA [Actinomycetota bacterium]